MCKLYKDSVVVLGGLGSLSRPFRFSVFIFIAYLSYKLGRSSIRSFGVHGKEAMLLLRHNLGCWWPVILQDVKQGPTAMVERLIWRQNQIQLTLMIFHQQQIDGNAQPAGPVEALGLGIRIERIEKFNLAANVRRGRERRRPRIE